MNKKETNSRKITEAHKQEARNKIWAIRGKLHPSEKSTPPNFFDPFYSEIFKYFDITDPQMSPEFIDLVQLYLQAGTTVEELGKIIFYMASLAEQSSQEKTGLTDPIQRKALIDAITALA